MAHQKIGRLVIGALLLSASACLKEDNTVTWFLEPSGQMTWSILERNVRSDSKDRNDRQTEEQQFLVAARVHQHPAETGLTRLGASNIKATILRDKAPFAVQTEGDFGGLEAMGRRLLNVYGMTGSSVISRDGEKWIWTFTIDYMPKDLNSDQDEAELTALFGDHLHVALREGEFVEAKGFSLDDDRRIAELTNLADLFEAHEHNDPPKVLKLVWRLLT